MLLLAAFSRHKAALDWARRRAIEAWGPVALESPPFDFTETDYYDATMGPGLQKVFFAFQRPFDPAGLVEIKLADEPLGARVRRRGRTSPSRGR